jgi:excisionase family DNA binding protein
MNSRAPIAKTAAQESQIQNDPAAALAPCPSGACEAHWARRRRFVPEFRANLCRECFAGRPLSAEADISLEHDRVIPREAKEKERDRIVLGYGMAKTVSVSVAARSAGVSPDTVLRLIEQGAIKAWRISRRGWYRVDFDSLTSFLNPQK